MDHFQVVYEQFPTLCHYTLVCQFDTNRTVDHPDKCGVLSRLIRLLPKQQPNKKEGVPRLNGRVVTYFQI